MLDKTIKIFSDSLSTLKKGANYTQHKKTNKLAPLHIQQFTPLAKIVNCPDVAVHIQIAKE